MLKVIKWLLLVVVTVAIVMIAIANRQIVSLSIDPFPYNVDMPLFLVIAFSLFVGVLLGGFSMIYSVYRSRMEIYQYQRKIEKMEKDLSLLKVDKEIRKQIPEY